MVKNIIVDVIGVAGLSVLFYGLYLYDPRIAYIIIGTLLIGFSIKAKV